MNIEDREAWEARRRAAIRSAGRRLTAVRTDTVAELLADLAANAGDVLDPGARPDIYGNGLVRELEERTAELLGTEDAAYFPTGTMAQQVALRCWSERTGSPVVAMHPLAHPEVHERRAYAVLGGLRAVWPTTAPRLPTPEEIRGTGEPFGTLMLELPLREAGFVLPTWEDLTASVDAAREQDAVVHLDGARLWESATHFGRTLPEIAGLADSVYVSFYKSLGATSGAALAGPADLIAEAKVWRHRYGGQLFQQWPAVLGALLGLERELPRLPEYTAHARTVAGAMAEAFAALPGAQVHPEPPHTHQFKVWLPYEADVLDEAITRQGEKSGTVVFQYWGATEVPGLSATEVTVAGSALEWTADDVRAAVGEFLELAAEAAADGAEAPPSRGSAGPSGAVV